MQTPSAQQNGTQPFWVVLRPEPEGQFTARVVGLPEIQATAPTKEEALQQVRAVLAEWVASGRLVSVDVPQGNPWRNLPGYIDPNDPGEQEYLEELARFRQEDLERTLREYDSEDQKCSGSSSTPTT
jgi:predicted RNase H-like HicB family nuclease